jgi:hypothetical protein
MKVKAQHSIETLRKVVDTLKQVDEAGGTYDDIVGVLKKLGAEAATRNK